MDPDRLLAIATDALRPAEERAEAAYRLRSWLVRGGFMPAISRAALMALLHGVHLEAALREPAEEPEELALSENL